MPKNQYSPEEKLKIVIEALANDAMIAKQAKVATDTGRQGFIFPIIVSIEACSEGAIATEG